MITEKLQTDKVRARVLVIDDCDDSMKLISGILSRLNCAVTCVVDGIHSLPLLNELHFDLVVIDWNMPQMGGSATLEAVDRAFGERAELKKIGTPFIIYSAQDPTNIKLPAIRNLSFMGTFRKSETPKELSKSFGQILQFI